MNKRQKFMTFKLINIVMTSILLRVFLIQQCIIQISRHGTLYGILTDVADI